MNQTCADVVTKERHISSKSVVENFTTSSLNKYYSK